MKYTFPILSLFLISSVTSQVCYRGNMKEHPAVSNAPPCWYKEADGTFSCYDYKPGTKGECPFPGNIKKPVETPVKKSEKKTCYRANMKQYPVPSGPDSPPCWYKEADGTYSCYEYEPHTKTCPNFPHKVKRPE